MPIRAITPILDSSDPPEAIGIRFDGVGPNGFVEVLYSQINGNGWNANRLTKIRNFIQNLCDVRIPLDDPQFMEDGEVVDPDALVDPARPDFFHDNGDLVARSIIVEPIVVVDGIPRLAVRRAR